MMGRTQVALALFGCALLPLPAVGASAHEHGVARLDVVIDGASLVISLESPLDNLLGFEHAPRNEKQRSAVKTMEVRLQTADIFKPSAEAACKPTAVNVEHPYKPMDSKPPAKDASAEAHSDVDVSWTYQCAWPSALQRIEVGLFTQFRWLKSLKVQLAGPRGQTATVLRPDKTTLVW